MAKRISLYPLLFTIFNDSIGWGVVLTIFAPLLFDSSNQILPSDTSHATRNVLLGFLLSSYAVMQFFSTPVIGALSDHWGRKRVLEGTIFMAMVTFVLSAVAIGMHSLILLFIARILGGGSANVGAAFASIADMSTEQTKAKNLALTGIIWGIAWILGPPMGGFLSTPHRVAWFGYSTPFWFLALLLLLNLIWIRISYIETLEKKERHDWKQEIKDLSKLSKIPRMTGWLIVALFFYFGWFTFKLYYPTLFVQKFRFTPEEIGYFSGYLAIFWMFGSFVLNRYFWEKINPEKLFMFLLPVEGIVLFLASWIGNIAVWIWTFPILSFFAAMGGIEILALTSNLAGKENQGKIFGITQSLMSLALFAGPACSGFMASYILK